VVPNTGEKSPLNWVDRRAIRERSLDFGAPKVWDEVRGSLQDACDSFNEHYPQSNRQDAAHCKLENGNRVKITRIVSADMKTSFQPQQFEVLVTFDKLAPSVTVAFPDNTAVFKIESDEESAFPTFAGKRITSDEISHKVLESVLFPNKQRTRPVSIRPTGSSSDWM
jgi:hypothetical protein